MSIKFNCPNCQKAHTVKDELAGKRAKCSGCQQVVTIPVPVSMPADVEDLAAAAFADAEQQEAPKEIKYVDFQCPFCDEKVKFDAELAGKQAQCPECKRLVKIPQLVKEEPKDWRKAKEQRGPSGAMRSEQPAPEGTWASTAAAKVSRQSLQEANVLPEEVEKLTVKQWVVRGSLVAGALAAVVLAVVLVVNFRSKGQQKDAFDLALKSISTVDSKTKMTAAEVHRGAGEYSLRLNTPEAFDEAKKHLGEARNLLIDAGPSRERDLLLQELALTQIDLAGDDLDVKQHLRLTWDKALQEVQQTLQNLASVEAIPNLPSPGPRIGALREVCRKLVSKGKPEAVASLTALSFPAGEEMSTEGRALIGLELVRANEPKAAELLSQNLEGASPAAVALYIALGQVDKVKELVDQFKEDDKLSDAGLLADALGLAHKGSIEPARLQARANRTPAYRVQALSAIAGVQDAQAGRADVEAAASIVEGKLHGKGVATTVLVQLVQAGIRAGATDRMKALVANVDPAVRNQLQLELFRAQLAATKDKADESLADEVGEKASITQGLAHEALARHNSKHESGILKNIGGWDEAIKPFGYIGAALGMQDK